MEQLNDRPNRWQALGERFRYWGMRSRSRQLWLFGFIGAVLLCLEYFFLFPELGIVLARAIGSLTLAALLLCPLIYLNYGYRHLKR
jgi:hypothetical protein